jgi:hypothetical protein
MAKVVSIKARNKVSTILSIVRCKVSLACNGPLGPSHNGPNSLPIPASTWRHRNVFLKIASYIGYKVSDWKFLFDFIDPEQCAL